MSNSKFDKRIFWGFLVFVALLLAFSWVIIPVRYSIDYPKSIQPQLNFTIRQQFKEVIDEKKPSVVLLGDSMLFDSINQERVSEILGVNSYKIGYPGSASALWYLITKTNIVVADSPPDYLVIFFRGPMLTVPDYRVNGKYFEFINEHATPDNKLLIDYAYLNQYSPLERWLIQYFPLYSNNDILRGLVDKRIKFEISGNILGYERDQVDISIEAIFEIDNLVKKEVNSNIILAENDLLSESNLNFRRSLDKSFLPEIIRMTNENGIQLILVQIKVVTNFSPRNEPENLTIYSNDLSEYLADQEVPFLDYRNDPRISDDMFKDLIHFNEFGRSEFTEFFGEELKIVIAGFED